MRFLLCTTLLILLFAGCRSSNILQEPPSTPPEYSVIYVIHGDANYLYHTADGTALQADEQALKEAKAVAQQSQTGEVFIFHQKPEDKILWLFPKKDRQFLYYRNGQKIVDRSYSPSSDSASFVRESQFYRQFSQLQGENSSQLFLYFGHEIPHRSGVTYHHSRPDASFNTDIFAKGEQTFLSSNNSSFDLTVLSTCNNGTPAMIHALAPFNRHVLASPQNLHLSHIDTRALPELIENKQLKSPNIGSALADSTYKRLSQFLQTAITLSVYDTQASEVYLSDMASRYENYINGLSTSEMLDDNRDCAQLPFFDFSIITEGVKTWYRPPRFGTRQSDKAEYSGWGCK